MSVIKMRDNRSGVTYVYERQTYWDKEKQQSRSHRKLIGKIDPATGEMIPTDGRGHRRRSKEQIAADTAGLTKAVQIAHYYYGATYLLDQIGKATGVEEDMQICFPDTYKEILSIVYFMILRNKDDIGRIDYFARTHKLPVEDMTVETCREVISTIKADQQKQFRDLQADRTPDEGCGTDVITVIPSYQVVLNQTKGEMKETGEFLLHLLILHSAESGTPLNCKYADDTMAELKAQRQAWSEKNRSTFNEEMLNRMKHDDDMNAVAVSAFDNIEDRLEIEAPKDSKYFMGYLSLIYLSYMEKQLRSSTLTKDYTIRGLLDELDLLECYEAKELPMMLGKVTKKLKDIYKAMGVKAPTAKG